MRILILSLNHAPELTGVGKYTGEMAGWLAARGHEVRVVAAPPYYPEWRVGAGHKAWRYRRETLNGVSVFRCPLYIPLRPTGFKRLLHLVSFALSNAPVLLKQALGWRPEVIMLVEPTIFCAPAVLLAARMSGAKTWLHIQDFEVEASLRLGVLPGFLRLLASPLLAMDRWFTRRFDRVSTISRGMENHLAAGGVQAGKIVSFPNWVDTERLRPDPAAGAAFRERLSLPEGVFTVLYSGNMGRKQGLEVLLEAARELRTEKDILFLLAGAGAERDSLEARAAAMALDNVRFLPLVPEGEAAAFFSAADLHVVVQRRGAADLVMPSKLAGILSVGGRALVTADPDTELGRLARENPGLFDLVPPEDASALARAVRDAVPRRTPGFHAPARRYVEGHFSAPTVLGALERELESLVRP